MAMLPPCVAVIARINNNCVVGQPQLVELVQNPSNLPVKRDQGLTIIPPEMLQRQEKPVHKIPLCPREPEVRFLRQRQLDPVIKMV